jgi:mxaA protein
VTQDANAVRTATLAIALLAAAQAFTVTASATAKAPARLAAAEQTNAVTAAVDTTAQTPGTGGDQATRPPSNPNTGPLPPGAVDKRDTAVTSQVEGEEAIVEQPRPFGYTLGDVLVQQVLLAPEFQAAQLPPLERAGLWFARRAATVQKGEDGRRWLVMEYQLVNAPQALMTVNLPVVTLKSKAGPTLTVAAWPVSVGPLTPQHAFAKGGLQELRPDHPAPKVPTSALQRQLEIWLTAFAATVAAWLAWWAIRSIRAAANQPFAKALREVRQAGDNNPDAWLALHRAFDRTAGRALQTSTLPALFKQAPHFEPQRNAIEQFYNQSNLRFFSAAPSRTLTSVEPIRSADPAQQQRSVSAAATDINSSRIGQTSAGGSTVPGSRPGPAAGGPMELSALAAMLRRIEKQHER